MKSITAEGMINIATIHRAAITLTNISPFDESI